MTSPSAWPDTQAYNIAPVIEPPKQPEPKPPVTEAEFWEAVDHIADRFTEKATTPEKVDIYHYLAGFPRAPKL